MNLHGILNKGQGRRRVERQVAMLAAIGVAMLGGIAAVATTAQADPLPKVWVCKYVSTPGNEVPQHFDGLITPNGNSLMLKGWDGKTFPFEFADAQVRSVAVALFDGTTEAAAMALCPTFPETVTVTPEATATLGSCTAAGHVDLVQTPGILWSGPTGSANDPTYTATAIAPDKLIGTGVFTFHGLSKIPSQSVNSAAACFVAKAIVKGVVKNAPVVAGEVENAPVVAGVVENAPAVKSLAFTGAETVPLGLSGLLALVLGAVLTVASRQRPKQARE